MIISPDLYTLKFSTSKLYFGLLHDLKLAEPKKEIM